MPHNYSAHALEPGSYNYWHHNALEPVLHNKRRHCDEKPTHHSWRGAPVHGNWRESPHSKEDQHTVKYNVLKSDSWARFKAGGETGI